MPARTKKYRRNRPPDGYPRVFICIIVQGIANAVVAKTCQRLDKEDEGYVRPEELGFGELFGRIRDAAIVAESETQRIVLWNLAATNIFGYSASEALNLRVEALVPEPLKAHHRAGMTRYLMTGGGPYIDSQELLELPALRKDGEQIHIELSLSPIGPADDTNGARRFVLALIREVTRRHRAEEELRRSEERCRLLVESVKDYAIFMLDPRGRVASWNEGAHRIKGYHREEILGRDFSVFYPQEDRERGKPQWELEVAQEKGTYEEEGWRLRKDGSRFWASVLITALRDESGALRGFSKVTRDVTARKQAEEEARRLNEILEEQVAERTAELIDRERRLKELVSKLVTAQEEERRRVAYEVHDGLTQVATATHQHLQIFASDHPPGSTVGEGELELVLGLARETVREARRIIEGLRPTALDDFGLAVAVRQLVEKVESEGLNIVYEEALGEERLPSKVETQLYRVTQEALTNIQKHAQATQAHITLIRQSGKVRLKVRDEGEGFDPEAAFSYSGDGRGYGERVGLSSMQERIALLGGQLEIMGTPGQGTSVVAEVPLAVSGRKGA
jgi:PAS domain S-box-containing protein